MRVVSRADDVRTARRAVTGIAGLVPTMGALHAGHIALVRASRAECDHTAVSIFVNPAQFDDRGDLDAYPRDLDRDLRLLAREGVDLVWTPPPEEVYPAGFQTFVQVRELSRPLEGAARHDHFTGVATVVTKLLLLFAPRRAYFGRKDAQQLAVVRRLTADLGLPVTIVGCPTVRTTDGLALSSRNELLSDRGRRRATALYRGLLAAGGAWLRGERRRETLLGLAREAIVAAGVELEYLSLADADSLRELPDDVHAPRALLSLAARVEGVRLIDNVMLPDDVAPHPAPGGAERPDHLRTGTVGPSGADREPAACCSAST
ncbi:MAG: pantoate--beta-alanine ligase [Spirochaetaceae bacterium]|nr:pantoate--beta-alanine ligase [Spirochaetaceae bacterium]